MNKLGMALVAYLGMSGIAPVFSAQESELIKFGNSREFTYQVIKQGKGRTITYYRADENYGHLINKQDSLNLKGILNGVHFEYTLGKGVSPNSLILSKDKTGILFFDTPNKIGGKDWASVHFWDTGQRATVYVGNSDAYQQPVQDKNPENMTIEQILRKIYSQYTESLNVNTVVGAYKPLEAAKLKPRAEKFEEPKQYKQLIHGQPTPEQLRAALISFLKED